MASINNSVFTDPMQKSTYDIDDNGIVDRAEIADAISGLTAAEITQLGKINATTISTTQWDYLGELNQALTQGSQVHFLRLDVTAQTPQITIGNTLHINANNDGGRKTALISTGEKEDETTTSQGQIVFQHDGAADDYKARMVLYLNDGSGVNAGLTVEALRIDSNLDLTLINNFILGGDKTLSFGAVTVSGQADYTPTVTFTNGTNIVNAAAHTFSNGDIIQFTTGDGGTVPAELSLTTDYYIVSIAAGTFQVSLTSGGAAITFTDNGTTTIVARLQPVLTISDHISIPDDKRIYFGNDHAAEILFDSGGPYLTTYCSDGIWFADSNAWNWFIGFTVDGTYMNYPDGAVIAFNNGGNDVNTYFKGKNDNNCFTLDAELDRVGIGVALGSHTGKFHVDQFTNDAAIPTLVLDQADESEGFINFIGSDRGVIAGATASLKSIRVEIGGVVHRLALYADA